MYVYCTYGIVLEYDSKKKTPGEVYFQNCQIFLVFLGGKEVIRFFLGQVYFFSNQSLYYRKGQQNCNFRFPTPWSRCIILTHSSLVLRYTHCNQGPKRKIHKTCMPPMKNLPKLYEWKCEKRPLPTLLI